jgi:hypothetical protein
MAAPANIAPGSPDAVWLVPQPDRMSNEAVNTPICLFISLSFG